MAVPEIFCSLLLRLPYPLARLTRVALFAGRDVLSGELAPAEARGMPISLVANFQ